MSDEAANCTECGEPCVTDCIKRRDAADEQHDFHVDCYITMLWWLGGHHDNPSENDPEWVEYRRKMRAAIECVEKVVIEVNSAKKVTAAKAAEGRDVGKPPRIGRKLLDVLRHAEHGLDSSAVTVHRVARERDSALRRGLIAERLPRDRRGAVYGLTERGAAMLAAWRAQFGKGEPITDEML